MANWWIIVVGGVIAITWLIFVWKLTGNEYLLAKKIKAAVSFVVPIVIAILSMLSISVALDKDVPSESPSVTVSEKLEPNFQYGPGMLDSVTNTILKSARRD